MERNAPIKSHLGMQSSTTTVSNFRGKGECIVKYAKPLGGFTPEEARLILNETRLYRAELASAGIALAPNHDLRVIREDGSWGIRMVDQVVGDGIDMRRKLQSTSSAADKEALVRKMLDYIANLPEGDDAYSTEVMGDFKPANLVDSPRGLVLVDYFMPKRRLNKAVFPYMLKTDGHLSAQGIAFLCGDRRGQFARLLDIFSLKFPDVTSYANDYAQHVIRELHPAVLPFVSEEIRTDFKRIRMIYQVRGEFFT